MTESRDLTDYQMATELNRLGFDARRRGCPDDADILFAVADRLDRLHAGTDPR